MDEVSHQLGLADEHLHEVGVRAQRVDDGLDRHLLLEALGAILGRLVDSAHAAFGQLASEAVARVAGDPVRQW